MSESSSLPPQQQPGAEEETTYVGFPGIRFVPTDQELIVDYLRAKLDGKRPPTDLVHEADAYGEHPKELTRRLGRSVEHFWYVFSSRQRKYPRGKRPSRSTGTVGRWKAIGLNTPILSRGKEGEIIGHKCVLTYEIFVYDDDQPQQGSKPRKPRTVMTEWKMFEFVAQGTNRPISSAPDKMLLNEWVLCKITRKAGLIMEAEEEGDVQAEAPLADEPYEEDEQLQNATPPDPSQQAQVQVPDILVLDGGADGSDGTEVVQIQGVDADLEPPHDGAAMDVHFVDWAYRPEPCWGPGNECGENFYQEQWNDHGNQFGATADPDPMVNQFEVPADHDTVLSLLDPQPWDVASTLLFPDELVVDEIVKADKNQKNIGKDNAEANNTPAPGVAH